MKHYVHVDEFDYVYQHVIGLEAPSADWIEVDFDATIAVASPNRFRLINGELVDSGKPKMAPARHLRWNGQDWADPRTPEQVTADAWSEVRVQRNKLLLDTDWTDTASAPGRMGQTVYDSWQTYRQALRDITTQPDPLNITWPTPPQA